MNSIIDKIRSRSRSGINASYKIVNDFESSSEKECSKMDKENEKIYSRLLSQAEKAHQAIRNSGLSMNLEVPIPPRPSNRDRFLLWKKRNISKKVIEQTEAVLFLESKGYKYNEHYEAYQAVDLATEIRKTSGENIEFKDNSKNFENVYNKHDKNIFRRRSMYRLKENERRNYVDNDFQSQSDMNTQNNMQQHVNIPELDDSQFQNLQPPIQPQSQSQPLPQQQSQTITQSQQQNSNLNFKSKHNMFNQAAAQSQNNFFTQNYSRIEQQNRNINSVKPSAPPAQINQIVNTSCSSAPSAPPPNNQIQCDNNLKRNISSPCIGFGACDTNYEC